MCGEGEGALPFLVDGRKCLVKSVNEREESQLDDVKYDTHLITPQSDFASNARKLEAITVLRCQSCSGLHAQRTC